MIALVASLLSMYFSNIFTIESSLSVECINDLRFNPLDEITKESLTAIDLDRNVEYEYRLPPPPDKFLVQQSDKIYHTKGWDSSPVVLEDYKFVFFTTAKVACTVWKQLFRRMTGLSNWKTINGPHELPYNPLYNNLTYLYHYNRTRASQIMTDPQWTRAIFVRDPKERFLSAYLDKVVRNPQFTIRRCCPRTKDCAPRSNDNHNRNSTTVSLSDFLVTVQTCENAHWAPQSRRMEPKYWPYINFVGHMETVEQDAKQLLERIGAWHAYGASGWGVNGTQSLFHAVGVQHATDAKMKLQSYYTPDLERQVDHYCYMDYKIPYLNLTRTSIFDEV